MLTRTTRRLLVALAAALLLAGTASTASARNFSITGQSFRVTWSSLEFASAEATIRCQVTLEGSFHTMTVTKAAAELMGGISRAIVKQESCAGGTVAVFNGVERYNGTTTPNMLPAHEVYIGFTGTLPDISAMVPAVGRVRFGFRDASGFCTGQYGNETDLVQTSFNREAGGLVSEVVPVEGRNRLTLMRRDGGILCPTTVSVRGRGALMRQGTTTRIGITLI